MVGSLVETDLGQSLDAPVNGTTPSLPLETTTLPEDPYVTEVDRIASLYPDELDALRVWAGYYGPATKSTWVRDLVTSGKVTGEDEAREAIRSLLIRLKSRKIPFDNLNAGIPGSEGAYVLIGQPAREPDSEPELIEPAPARPLADSLLARIPVLDRTPIYVPLQVMFKSEPPPARTKRTYIRRKKIEDKVEEDHKEPEKKKKVYELTEAEWRYLKSTDINGVIQMRAIALLYEGHHNINLKDLAKALDTIDASVIVVHRISTMIDLIGKMRKDARRAELPSLDEVLIRADEHRSFEGADFIRELEIVRQLFGKATESKDMKVLYETVTNGYNINLNEAQKEREALVSV